VHAASRYLASSVWRGRASGQGTHGSQSTSLILCSRSSREGQDWLVIKALGNEAALVLVTSGTETRRSEVRTMDGLQRRRGRRPGLYRQLRRRETVGGRGEAAGGGGHGFGRNGTPYQSESVWPAQMIPPGRCSSPHLLVALHRDVPILYPPVALEKETDDGACQHVHGAQGTRSPR
jgi:hypothetical protein